MIITNPAKDLTYRVLKTVADADAHDRLCWFVETNNTIVFYVDVSAEFNRPLLVRIHEDNIHVLEDALARVKQLTNNSDQWAIAMLLFACRAQAKRPPASAYPQDFKALWPWLDICGPPPQITFFTDESPEAKS